jgi:hypothetical protein
MKRKVDDYDWCFGLLTQDEKGNNHYYDSEDENSTRRDHCEYLEYDHDINMVLDKNKPITDYGYNWEYRGF